MQQLHDALVYQTAMGPVWAVVLTLVGLPLANEVVQRAKGTRAESLLQAVAMTLLKIPVLGVVIAKFPVVGDILYVFSPANKVGLNLPTPLIAKPTAIVVPAVEITINKETPNV